jgi:oxamate amidohydrolase
MEKSTMAETPVFTSAAVAAPHFEAAKTGQAVLAEGGNAIEAMVAMAATIAVVYPHMNSIGGDAFWLVHQPGGKIHAIEACGYAGSGATIEAYRRLGHDVIPKRGPLAALTVPGAIGGWKLALEMAAAFHGRIPLERLLSDAVRLARDGYTVSASEGRYEIREIADVMALPGFRKEYCDKEGKVQTGALRKHPRLADTFEHLARAGLHDFYEGDIAREMAADLEEASSPVTREDLRRYSARTREPLYLRLPGVALWNFPPPTQGLVTLMIQGMLEKLGNPRIGTVEHVHGLIEAIKRGYALRDRIIADPHMMHDDPLTFLSNKALQAEAAAISMRRAADHVSKLDHGDTIWMGAIDKDGLAVSMIQSIFWDYGSGLVLPKTGVLMQNRGIAFSLDAASHRALKPGLKPFHTLNPGMAVFEDGRVLSYGTMGGDAQPQILAQNFSKIRAGMGLAEAMAAPRLLWGLASGAPEGGVRVEEWFDAAVLEGLERLGHAIHVDGPEHPDKYGHSGALVKMRRGEVHAAHDPRSDGGAMGL